MRLVHKVVEGEISSTSSGLNNGRSLMANPSTKRHVAWPQNEVAKVSYMFVASSCMW